MANAATRDGAIWDVDCSGFTSEGGGFELNRDNTGLGLEVLVITAVDGNGNMIFGPVAEDFFIGTTVIIEDGTSFKWMAPPQANPLTVTVFSAAGNGQVPQLVYSVSGVCPGLPEENILQDPSVSVPVDPEEDVAIPQPGTLVVDTFRLNVRSGDGPEFTIIGQVSGGQSLAVLGVNAERSWWYVQAGDLRGWIRGDTELVIVRGDLRATPVVEARGTILPPRLFVFLPQNIYTRPDQFSPVICQVPGDQEYVIDRRTADGIWYGIEAVCDGQPVVGWIKAEFGALRNLGNVPIPVTP